MEDPIVLATKDAAASVEGTPAQVSDTNLKPQSDPPSVSSANIPLEEQSKLETSKPDKVVATGSNESTTQKILHFWNHPSLEQVTPVQKQEYLKSKGIAEEQIFQAWDSIMESQSQQQLRGNNSSEDLVSSFQSKQQKHELQQPAQHQTRQASGIPASTPFANALPSHDHQASPYSSQNNYYTSSCPYYEDYEEKDGLYAAPSMALIATVGGFLGLVAAAAVRWLNGGDFLLFPPPSRGKFTDKRALTPNASLNRNNNETVTEESEEEADSQAEDDDEELEDYLSSPLAPIQRSDADRMEQAMSQLAETFQDHVTVQQRILQKLSSSAGSGTSVTDLSMQALRKHQQKQQEKHNPQQRETGVPDPMLWYKLVEIQVELASLKRDWSTKENKSAVTKRLEETLEQLQAILPSLKPQSATKTNEGSASMVVASEKKPASTRATSPTSNINASTGLVTSDNSISQPAYKADDTKPASCTPVMTSDGLATTTPPATAEGNNKSQLLLQVRTAIIDLVRKNASNPKKLEAGIQILYLYVSNLSKNPHVPRFRKVFAANESFKKVDRLQGGKAFLCAIGFVASADNRVLEWPPSTEGGELTAEDKDNLVRSYHLSEVSAALAILKTINDSSADQSTILDLLEKALDVLPCPLLPAAAREDPTSDTNDLTSLVKGGESSATSDKPIPQSPSKADGDAKPASSTPAMTCEGSTTAAPPATEEEDDKSQLLRQVRTSIIDLVRKNTDNPKDLKAGTQILYLYVSNLSKNPHVQRFRKVFTANESFKKVERLQGGKAFLCAIGFAASTDNRVLEWSPSTEGKELATEDKEDLVQSYYLSEVSGALAILKTINDSSADQTATLDLLEKALDVLPCPAPLPAAAAK